MVNPYDRASKPRFFKSISWCIISCDIIKIQVVVFQYNLNFVKRKHTHFSVIYNLKIGDKIHLKCSNVLIVLFLGGSIMGDLYFLIVHFLHS